MKLEEFAPESCLDDKMRALCAALDAQIDKLSADSRCVLHLPRLDELSGKILDVLADQLHCDFYDSLLFDDDAKRSAIRNSIAWHRRLGTRWAVEKVCADYGQDFHITEWFEDGDPPGWFRVGTNPFYLQENYDSWLRAVLIAKNVRSWCAVRFQYDEYLASRVGIATFIHGSITVRIGTESQLAHVTAYAGVATFIHGAITARIN